MCGKFIHLKKIRTKQEPNTTAMISFAQILHMKLLDSIKRLCKKSLNVY